MATTEEGGFLEPEEDFITIGYMPSLPALAQHYRLDMVSRPSMTQEEYEHRILDLGPIANNPDDDYITILCPGEVDGDIVRKFTMKRSSLQRSAPLNHFFESKNYRFGCGMTLHFTEVPGVCFKLVKDYLEKGPDRYTQADITKEVFGHYSDAGKRLEIYARLHKCARQLELCNLKTMAWTAIQDDDMHMGPEHCVTLASFVFADQANFGYQIKTWLMGHIKKHFDVLNANPVVAVVPHLKWDDVVDTLSPGFKKEWKNLVTDHKSRLSVVEEEQDEQEQLFAKVLKSLDTADLDRAERAIRTVKDEKGAAPQVAVVAGVVQVNGNTEDSEKEVSDEWEDLDHPAPDISRAADDSKAREVLGAPMDPRYSTSTEPTPRHPSIDMETAKARLVMGINSPSQGTIAGRRKQPALTRAAKSLTNLMRAPATH
ncbi:hypothetical protein ACLMJK_006436 [Lecanora helva]